MKTNYIPKTKFKMYLQNYCNRLLSPIKTSSAQLSIVASLHDDVAPSDYLFDISVGAINEVKKIDVSDIAAREKNEQKWVSIYPGEHYKLLGALMHTLQPKIVIEIGTFLGQASLVIKKYIPADAVIHTFDIIAWNEFRDTCFLESDFKDGKLIQHTDDLTTENGFRKHVELLKNADFIFVDALKDGIQEKKILDKLEQIQLKKNCIVMFDDIRVWNMVKIWRDIKRPKMDLTSFGHWSGTGLIDWNGKKS